MKQVKFSTSLINIPFLIKQEYIMGEPKQLEQEVEGDEEEKKIIVLATSVFSQKFKHNVKKTLQKTLKHQHEGMSKKNYIHVVETGQIIIRKYQRKSKRK